MPDGGDLGFRVIAVYEVVVEGVARSFVLARPQQRLVGVGKGGVESIWGWIEFLSGDLVCQPLRIQTTLLWASRSSSLKTAHGG